MLNYFLYVIKILPYRNALQCREISTVVDITDKSLDGNAELYNSSGMFTSTVIIIQLNAH